MTTNEQLVHDLQARGITPLDLEDTLHALIQDKHAAVLAQTTDEAGKDALAKAFAAEADALTAGGLHAQVAWMDSYYNNREHLTWALSGYLNLPLAA
ncbi:hypothetical protein WJ96_07090 [Burkholderia ubonensis]|uniref:Uncharacterized protein n=1 Tax=Burkholderia ubonensis TaxID=101571 RepID=A0AAW3MWG4_9BURK|nr:hypothetical protein [Burkholderia ubonensis]KVP75465.1 hypothetical protein WJ93_08885 [Burkholderia ubonensis]KVP96928.1 hypothetical protein WJ97_13995 [Burkholderia ubonensis]KVP98278.1 hypothetical protein WJ96_07090 [Burkholderia ubonensis]KVZ92976.1 hypothetical protein WL25_18750 [Burkholderia ubonensis]